MVKEYKIDNLHVEIHENRQSIGQAAAFAVANKIRALLSVQDEIRMIFAAAPSQNELLNSLTNITGINWEKITAFHMDEYVGLSNQAPQRFGNYLKEKLFEKVTFKQVYYIDTISRNALQECERYEGLLKEAPIDIICMGIGENGHIAFNDPPVADFKDPLLVKVVELDQECRQQQVNDGCFATINEVPKKAITLSVPALFEGKHLFIVVPGKSKSKAVYNTIKGEVSTKCPASILLRHSSAILFLDKDSASEINKNRET